MGEQGIAVSFIFLVIKADLVLFPLLFVIGFLII
jgi:hypothetical protein